MYLFIYVLFSLSVSRRQLICCATDEPARREEQTFGPEMQLGTPKGDLGDPRD